MIILMRHAHTDWNGPPKRFQGQSGIGISDQGRNEAKNLAAKLLKPDHIYASPAQRVKETITTLFPDNNIPIVYDTRLLEMNTGKFTGLLESEVATQYPQDWINWQTRPGEVKVGDGESLQELLQRSLAVLQEIEFNQPVTQNTLVVTHGGIIRTLLCFTQHKDLNEYHSMLVSNLGLYLYKSGMPLALYTLHA